MVLGLTLDFPAVAKPPESWQEISGGALDGRQVPLALQSARALRPRRGIRTMQAHTVKVPLTRRNGERLKCFG